MADVKLQTYSVAGTFTFTATTNGLHRFHVIGKGGDGGHGGATVGQNGGYGGNGGAGGGYAIHEATLIIGETINITIDAEKTILECQGTLVTAKAGGIYTNVGTADGGNVSNVNGAQGTAGTSTRFSTSSGKQYIYGGSGGRGASSVGTYQANGGSGGSGGSYNAGSVSSPRNGESPVNTTASIGGAGGGGGAGVWGSSTGKSGVGAMGGVVIEFVNSAPTVPSYIDAGDVIVADQESTVSWGASTDTNGNLAGYVLERSVDGGAWAETYRGSSRNITDAISPDWTTVQYRVKAYDAEGAESGYISTEKLTVVHNSPPSAPGPISLPPEIHGGTTITASWGRAMDVDNNLTGYTLEQSVDGGEWTEIKNTAEITAQVPIAYGWQTVQLRVRAYDSYGAVGQYVASPVVTIINNRAPTISGEDQNLGVMTDIFEAQHFIVDDPDGDEVTVTIKLDGVDKDTFIANSGEENTLDIPVDEWRKLPNGDHSLAVIARDRPLGVAEGKQSIRTFTFNKSVRTISFRLANPMAADAMPEKCILSAQGAFPDGCVLCIEVCNNANDETPAWDDITQKVLTGQKHFFRNGTKTAEAWGVGVRVSLERGTATGDCYIHSLRGNYA